MPQQTAIDTIVTHTYWQQVRADKFVLVTKTRASRFEQALPVIGELLADPKTVCVEYKTVSNGKWDSAVIWK